MIHDRTLTNKHVEMVLRLGKPGQTILETLTAWDCNLLHMGGCLPGEASELYDAVTESLGQDEMLEELGDFAFYLVAVRAAFKLKQWAPGDAHICKSPEENALQLMRISGHFWDVVKRITIYRKEMDKPDKKFDGKSLEQVAGELLTKLEAHFLAILRFYGLTVEQVLQANWEKLADADKGRYASGTYSDSEAQNRRDKDPATQPSYGSKV